MYREHDQLIMTKHKAQRTLYLVFVCADIQLD